MNEQATVTVYEPPVLVELGGFGEDTLGFGGEGDEPFMFFDDE